MINTNDLIVNINIKETNKIKKPVVEIGEGIIKKLKNKTFSGQFLSTKILKSEYRNLKNQDIVIIRNIILNRKNNQIGKNKYAMEYKLFNELIKFCTYKNILYCTSKDKKMHLIEAIDLSEKIEVEIKNNKIKLFYEGENNNIVFSSGLDILELNKFNIVYDNNRLTIFKGNLDSKNIHYLSRNKFIIDKKAKEILKEGIISKTNNLITNNSNNYETINPEPILYIFVKENKIEANVEFKYHGIDSNNISDKLKNKYMEKMYLNKLLDFGWKKDESGIYVLKNFNTDDIQNLIEFGFILLTEKNKSIETAYNTRFNMKYNIDWFELDGEIKVEEKVYKLSEILDINSNKKYVEIDNKVIFLPTVISEKMKILNKIDNKITINKIHIGQALELANNLGIYKTLKLENIIQYEDISISIPNGLNKILRDYQIKGIKWLKYMYMNGFGSCLADDMGLGKTLQIIGFLSDEDVMLRNKLCIIVVPKALISNWKREIEKFNDSLDVSIYHGSLRFTMVNKMKQGKGIFITTYGTILNDVDKICDIKIDCLVMDEVQQIKNSQNKTYKSICKLKASSKIALSGTPFENNIGEVWSIMSLLNKEEFEDKNKFVKKYLNIVNDKKCASNLKVRINPYILRRTKKEVLKDFPEKIEQNIYCDMDESQRELYQSILLNIKNEISKEASRYQIKNNSIYLEGLMYLREVCCHPKLLNRNLNINKSRDSGKFEIFKLKTEELVNNKNKVIVFSQFTKMLSIMEEWIVFKKWKYYYIDGNTKDRQGIVDEFEQSEEGILLISLKAGGVGLNLTSCNNVIIYDPWWNPAVEEQASDRVYRIGQQKNVNIYKLITTNSIEEKIQKLKNIKKDTSDTIFDGTWEANKFTIEDIKSIILD